MTSEENDFFTRVGAGTPGGELLRRYWHPIAGVAELAERARKRVKLLGEELVLFRDANGELGLMEERCPHRSCSLYYGIPEPGGLRCPYHGWLFDLSGQCLETPAEPDYSRFSEKVKINGYPVKELGGLVFAYLGPEPVPVLPPWDLYVEQGRVIRQIGYAVLPCNWFQIMENSVDPYHTDWLHGYFFRHVTRVAQEGNLVPENFTKGIQVRFEPFEYGIRKFRIRDGGTPQDDEWTIGHPLVFPMYLRISIGGRGTFQIRVPMDDQHTLHFFYDVVPVPDDQEFSSQNVVPCIEINYRDERGEFILTDINNQDTMAWITQGPITDRTRERLGSSDRGIQLFRDLYKDQVRRVQEGLDPICTFRDPSVARIDLPVSTANHGKRSLSEQVQFWRSFGLGPGNTVSDVENILEGMALPAERQ